MNYSPEVEKILDIDLLVNGSTVKVRELSVEDQIDFLIEQHFDVFRSDVFKTWRVQNCYYLSNKKSQKVLFKFNKAQKHFVENVLLKGFRKVIILKSRQLGMTTLVSLWFLDHIIFNPDSTALQAAHTLKDGTDLFNSKIAYAVRNLCPAMLGILNINQNRANRVEFVYPNGSTSSLSMGTSARSKTVSYLHISELAKLSKLYPNRADEVTTGTMGAVPATNSLVIIESTAEGVVGLFYEMYMESYKRRDTITPAHTVAEFYPVFYNWTWDTEQIHEVCSEGIIPVSQMEESDINWREFQLEYDLSSEEMTFYYTKWIQNKRDIHKLNQEYPTTVMDAFISTGANFFSTKKIFKELEKLQEAEPEYKTYDWNGTIFIETDKAYSDKFEGLVVFSPAIPGKHYALGGDVAEGLMTGDYSTATVLGMDKLPKAVYKGHIEPDDYTKMVFALGKMYNDALMGIEFNKDGNWVNTELVRMEYPNMFLRTSFDDISQTMTRSYGWVTNKQTRDVALGEFKSFFNACTDFPYKIILDEMVSFVRDKRGKAQAQHGKHDDCFVMGTKIETSDGSKNIEDIKVGDLVLTRGGFQKVLNTKSSYKGVVKNIGLVGTPTHPIITVSGEINLTSVADSDTLHIWNTLKQKIEKQSFIMVKNTTEIQTQTEDNTEFIIGDMISTRSPLLRYIGKFGLTILEKFQGVLLYTTKTITHLIIALKILNVKVPRNTQKNTCLNQKELLSVEKMGKNNQKELLDNLKNGNKDLRIKEFTQKYLKHLTWLRLRKMFSVLFVKIFLNLGLTMLYIALVFAKIMQRIINVLKVRKVYNLYIENYNEYFANKVLVHNCVMSTGIAYGMLQNKIEAQEEKKEINIFKDLYKKT